MWGASNILLMLLRRYFSEPTTSRRSFSPTPDFNNFQLTELLPHFSNGNCCYKFNLTSFSKAHFFEMDNWSVEFYVLFLFFVFLKKQNKTKKTAKHRGGHPVVLFNLQHSLPKAELLKCLLRTPSGCCAVPAPPHKAQRWTQDG